MADPTDHRSQDDRRMHEGRTPGLVAGRGHERHEEPVRLDHPEPGEEQPADARTAKPDDSSTTRDRHQESALGGEVATRSSTRPTPPDERFQ